VAGKKLEMVSLNKHGNMVRKSSLVCPAILTPSWNQFEICIALVAIALDFLRFLSLSCFFTFFFTNQVLVILMI